MISSSFPNAGADRVTICPCCGFKFHGALSSGCENCGAQSVGEALPRPEHELPSYGRSLVLVVSGFLVALVFVVQTIIAMIPRASISLGFWSWVAAGETAAWRLKWISIAVVLLVIWAGRKLYASILRDPVRFCGVKYARSGLLASVVVGLLIATLIGITVPARLRQRQMSIEAGGNALYYTYDRALFEYKLRFGTLPDQATLKEDLARLPDPDGAIAAALRELDTTGYKPSAEVASNKQNSRTLRGALIRKVSLNSATDDMPAGGVSFTNYDLRLPGADKILGNDDDWVGHDGVLVRVSDLAKGGVGRTASAEALRP